jgi:hypothetical protein
MSFIENIKENKGIFEILAISILVILAWLLILNGPLLAFKGGELLIKSGSEMTSVLTEDCTMKEDVVNENFMVDGKNLTNIEIWVIKNLGWAGCKVERTTFVGKARDYLGFDKPFFDFFLYDIWPGLVAGLLLFGANWLSSLRKNVSSLWLSFLADKIWKAVLIGVFYGVLMQIPVLNRFLEIITFKPLGVNWFFRAILFAFYIGLFPAFVESYTRYRIRKKYYKAIQYEKYEKERSRLAMEG